VLERFFALDGSGPTQYRALRRLDARNDKFNSVAWMDAWTDADPRGFRYEIVAEGGSHYIRSRVFRETLEAEQRSWTSHAHERAMLNRVNYSFEDATVQDDGLVRVSVKPRRNGLLLVDGWIFLRQDGDLVRIEGQMTKSPSFWARGVQVVRRYERVAGLRVPVGLETVSNLRIAGKSSFTMRWAYESVNGKRVGNPEPRRSARIDTQ